MTLTGNAFRWSLTRPLTVTRQLPIKSCLNHRLIQQAIGRDSPSVEVVVPALNQKLSKQVLLGRSEFADLPVLVPFRQMTNADFHRSPSRVESVLYDLSSVCKLAPKLRQSWPASLYKFLLFIRQKTIELEERVGLPAVVLPVQAISLDAAADELSLTLVHFLASHDQLSSADPAKRKPSTRLQEMGFAYLRLKISVPPGAEMMSDSSVSAYPKKSCLRRSALGASMSYLSSR